MEALKIVVPVPPGTRYANYFDVLDKLGARGIAAGGEADLCACDGLLLPGGGDIDPARYHRANTACGRLDPALDEMQFSTLDAFVKAQKPVFGICRGLQLINVYFGGTLIQHLSQSPRHRWDERGADRAHDSVAIPGSWLAGMYGERFCVNSAHHQGVDALGKGLIVAQRSDDGVVEALRHSVLPIYAVQWHPERMCFDRARPDTVDGSVVLRDFLDRVLVARRALQTGGE
ncbi:MAG: gamma-glutamyl-gamma-aminobutyrate hydrolase family protein [Clostridia bacterium]|nr:gamma-glutamyl-gamma-aminobutyrate hydrolase family protein [Clostridia bacterium]